MFNFNKPSLFGATQASPFTPATTQTAFSLGTKPATSTTPFSFLSQPTTSAPGLAMSNAFSSTFKPGSLLGSNFGKPTPTSQAAQSTLFSFQANQNALGVQAAPTSIIQQQQQQLQTSVDSFYASLSQPLLFGDERDNIIARLNQFQAMLGAGTGYSALGAVVYTPDNAFSRFRGIAYNLLPTSSEADGLVCLELAIASSQVMAQKQGLQDHLFRLLGSRANLQLIVEEIRPASRANIATEVVIKVVERQATGSMHVIPASDLANYLSSPTIKPQLEAQLQLCRLTSEVAPSAAQLNAYLDTPPAGFDRFVWQQARANNPSPDCLIPVPVVGFTDLNRRRLDQLLFGDQQRKSVKHLLNVAGGLRTRQFAISQKIAQMKRKQIELGHRILKLLARQTVVRRSGFAISAEEETLRCALEHIWTELASPRGVRARCLQLLPALRTAGLDGASTVGGAAADSVDKAASATAASELTASAAAIGAAWWQQPEIIEDLKEYLNQRNNGIKEMRSLLLELMNVSRLISNKSMPVSIGSSFVVDSPVKPPILGTV